MRRVAGLSLILFVSACVAPEAPPAPTPPAPVARPAPPPPPPPPADWRDRPYTAGDWSYSRTAGLSEAQYGQPGMARLMLGCDPRSAQLRLTWPGAPAGPVTIRTTYGDVRRDALQGETGAHIIFAATDPLLDQIAFSRGRFMLATAGQELIVPAWPEVSRVIEDCR